MIVVFSFLLSCVAYGSQPQWDVQIEVGGGSTYVNFREEVVGTEMISFSPSSGNCASGITIQECSEKFQYNISAMQTAISGKMDEPTGTASGSKFLRDDKTWQSIPEAQVNSDWSASSGIAQILNKPSLSTVATSGSYDDLSNKPSIQAIQRTRAQTNTSGVYTWNYPNAYSGGVIPIIQAQVEDGTSGAIWNVQLTSVSNTSATVQITKTAAVTILGISVLGIQANPQAYVHFTALAP